MHFPPLSLSLHATGTLLARLTDSRHVPLTRRDAGVQRRDGSVNLSVLDAEIQRTTIKYAAQANCSFARRDPEQHLRKRYTAESLLYDGEALWTGAISVGTPPQTFQVYYDTASTDLSLAAAACTDSSCSGKARYDWLASTTAAPVNFSVGTDWSSGTSGHGALMRDTVTIGSSKVVQQDIVSSAVICSYVSSRNADGVLGLAFPDTSAARSSSFPFSLFKQQGAKTFSMRLSRVPGASKIFFEGLDRSIAASAPTFFPVARDPDEDFRTYWQIRGSTAFVNGTQAYGGRVNFILDSSSSVIIAPPSAAADFWSNVADSRAETSGYYSFPCSSPPSVALNFGGSSKLFSIDAQEFNLGTLTTDPTRCLGALVSQNLNLWDSWTIGDVFLKSWLLTFDIARSRIGITTPSDA